MTAQIRIKDLSDAATRSLRNGYKRYDTLVEREEMVVSRIFAELLSGRADVLYKDDGKDLKVYHRSPKKEGYIQLSVADIREGKLIPVRDSQFLSPKDMYDGGIDPGVWYFHKN